MGSVENGDVPVYAGDYGPLVQRLAAEAGDAETRGAEQGFRSADMPQQPGRDDAELADRYAADQDRTVEQLEHAAAASGSIGQLVAANTVRG